MPFENTIDYLLQWTGSVNPYLLSSTPSWSQRRSKVEKNLGRKSSLSLHLPHHWLLDPHMILGEVPFSLSKVCRSNDFFKKRTGTPWDLAFRIHESPPFFVVSFCTAPESPVSWCCTSVLQARSPRSMLDSLLLLTACLAIKSWQHSLICTFASLFCGLFTPPGCLSNLHWLHPFCLHSYTVQNEASVGLATGLPQSRCVNIFYSLI